MTATTYTVIDSSSGEARYTGLSLADAAHEVLTDDGREYDIRADKDGGYTLWTRQQVANRGWEPTVVYSIETDQAKAEAEIFGKVIAAGWPRHPEVMTDAAYAKMVAQFEADSE